jgi:uncharacterized protein with PQ loop repeat
MLHTTAANRRERRSVHIFGVLAMIASLTITAVGFPMQIVANYRRKSVEGISTTLVVSAMTTYTLWALYGWTKPDWFLVISQTPGCMIAGALLLQIRYYSRKANRERGTSERGTS